MTSRRKRIRWWDRVVERTTQMVADWIDPRGAAIHRRRSEGSRKAWQTRRAQAGGPLTVITGHDKPHPELSKEDRLIFDPSCRGCRANDQ